MKPLPKEQYHKLAALVASVPFNNYFARAVTEQVVNGQVFVDDETGIKTAYIINPYGMTLLLGDSQNEDFNRQFKAYALNSSGERNMEEWMQTCPRSWDAALEQLFGDRLSHNKTPEAKEVFLQTRVNFKFNTALYLAGKTAQPGTDAIVVPVTRNIYHVMEGSVIPRYFWNHEDDFFNRGMAYALMINDRPVSMAFSSFRFEQILELGIETIPAYRGKGLAEIVCAALIDYCLENNYEPVWACRKQNTGSYKLAQKLGFEPVLELPYYRLPV